VVSIASVARWLLHAVTVAVLLLWTWLWLLPVGAFHHMVRCGVLGWAILDGENEVFTVRWSVLGLVLSVAAWLVGGMVAWKLRRAIQGPAPGTATTPVGGSAEDVGVNARQSESAEVTRPDRGKQPA
jgi:hypothetical protein